MPDATIVACPRCGSNAEPTEPGSFIAFPKGAAPERTPGTDLAWCESCEAPFEVPQT